jgi:uncharacterized cupredoxin-like copper-binding protein
MSYSSSRAATVMLLMALPACGSGGGHARQPAAASAPRLQTFGHGDLAGAAQRVVEIRMSDNLRFEPSTITVRRGEIVALRVINTGRAFHELTIGGQAAQDLHDAQMASMDMSGSGGGMAMPAGGEGMHMNMGHDPAHEKYMKALTRRIAELDRTAAMNESVHVPAGESRDLTWAFTGPQAPLYGCHIVGHFAAGMRGTFSFSG